MQIAAAFGFCNESASSMLLRNEWASIEKNIERNSTHSHTIHYQRLSRCMVCSTSYMSFRPMRRDLFPRYFQYFQAVIMISCMRLYIDPITIIVLSIHFAKALGNHIICNWQNMRVNERVIKSTSFCPNACVVYFLLRPTMMEQHTNLIRI